MPPSYRRHQTSEGDRVQSAKSAHVERAASAWNGRERDLKAEGHTAFLDQLAKVARDAPQVRTAHALLTNNRVLPVPIDADLRPVADPLDDVDAILDHWTANPDHQIGVATGHHPQRPWTYLAVAVDTFGAWQEWLKSASTLTTKVPDLGGYADVGDMSEVGPPKTKKTHRNTGGFTRLLWIPPALPSLKRWKMDAAGSPLTEKMQEARTGRGGWIFAAVPDPDHNLSLRRGREVTAGVRVEPTGTVVPWEGTTNLDGWTLRLSTPAQSQNGLAPAKGDTFAPWLVEKLVGKRNTP